MVGKSFFDEVNKPKREDRQQAPGGIPLVPGETYGDGVIEDTQTEDEMFQKEDLPMSLEEITVLPNEEDEFHLIDYLMGHNPEEQS